MRVLGEFGVDGVEPQVPGSKTARLALQGLALGAGQVLPPSVLVDALAGGNAASGLGEDIRWCIALSSCPRRQGPQRPLAYHRSVSRQGWRPQTGLRP